MLPKKLQQPPRLGFSTPLPFFLLLGFCVLLASHRLKTRLWAEPLGVSRAAFSGKQILDQQSTSTMQTSESSRSITTSLGKKTRSPCPVPWYGTKIRVTIDGRNRHNQAGRLPFPPPSTFYLLLGSRDILFLSLFAHLSASCLITPVGRRDLITSNTFDASAELHALFGKPLNLRDVSFARVLRHP